MKKQIIFLQTLLFFFFFFNFNNISYAQVSNELEVMIPLYIYPELWHPKVGNIEGYNEYLWAPIEEAQKKVNITAIINPNDGPTTDPTKLLGYKRNIKKLNDSGVKVYGYVSTGYINPNKYRIKCGNMKVDSLMKIIKGEIAIYYTQTRNNGYHLDGIFFDEVANADDLLHRYQELYKYTKSLDASWNVILNTGVKPTPKFLATDNPAGNKIVSFEQSYGNISSMSMSAGATKNYAALVHSISSGNYEDAKKAIDKARVKNYGYVYVTDDQFKPNPFDNLSTFWAKTIDYIKKKNDEMITPGNLDNAIIRNGWRTKSDVAKLSDGDKRNILVIEIHQLTNGKQDISFFQSQTNLELSSYATCINALITKHDYPISELKKNIVGNHRNALVVLTQLKNPEMTVEEMQGMTNFQLAEF
ncbi:MAG: spherulation-specific family 4 protein [Saprospiraceae bacterium]